MTGVLENFVVGLLVTASAIFSAWRLLSARWRLRFLDVMQPVLERISGRWFTSLRRRTLGQLGGSCGGCSHNGNAAPVKK